MRILHLDSGRQMRGGQWQVLYLAHGLRARGHEVKLLARRGGPLLAAAASGGADADTLTLGSFAALLSWADILHAHDARTHTLAAFSAVRTVVSRRVAFRIGTGLLSRWKYSGADHYIAVSRFVARQLIAAGIQSSGITVIHDGVPLIAPNGLPATGPIVAPLTDDPMKGSDLARQAALLAGVEICFSADLMNDLQRAGLFVYISREEGLGSAVLLAMMHGVPVVTSRVGGLPEIVEDGRTGFLVDNDAAEIARAIRKLVAQPELAAEMGRRAREFAERFSVDRMVDETIRVYEKVLANA